MSEFGLAMSEFALATPEFTLAMPDLALAMPDFALATVILLRLSASADSPPSPVGFGGQDW